MEVFTQSWMGGGAIESHRSPQSRISSIQDHLARLLNARQGALSHLPDYGLPDVTDLYGDMPYTTSVLEQAIVVCIERFEPRLRDIKIVRLPPDRARGLMVFEIKARLLDGEQAAFRTYLTSSGHARVMPGSTTDRVKD